MKDDQSINKQFHILQRNKLLKDKDKFVFNEIGKLINLSLEGINLSVNSCLEIGSQTNINYEYIKKRFSNVNFVSSDISEYLLKNKYFSNNNLSFDHDNWNLSKNKFDLIISNLYLHLTNNLDLLLKNINFSLEKNGFLIATVPNTNCFYQLKESMIKADLLIYGGAYQRFNNFFSIEKINKALKKNNYKIPVIELDSIELRYSSFSQLIKDIRYLGNTNINNNRKKKFENKKYFQKVEEIYWRNFSTRKKLILSLEVIYITGWKEDSSQQRPLRPGEAKSSLKDYFK